MSVACHIGASPALVWQIMTERLTEWWCPKPWQTEIVALDWHAGGRCAMVMRGPNGEESPVEGVFLEVVPGARWVFTDALTVGWQPKGPFMVGVWEIAAEGDGAHYRASARHWTQEAYDQHKTMGFADGWGAVAGQLKALAEAEASGECG
ncbi:MAG: SRPBCC domain-containing protein [Sphingomonas sp.]